MPLWFSCGFSSGGWCTLEENVQAVFFFRVFPLKQGLPVQTLKRYLHMYCRNLSLHLTVKQVTHTFESKRFQCFYHIVILLRGTYLIPLPSLPSPHPPKSPLEIYISSSQNIPSSSKTDQEEHLQQGGHKSITRKAVLLRDTPYFESIAEVQLTSKNTTEVLEKGGLAAVWRDHLALWTNLWYL